MNDTAHIRAGEALVVLPAGSAYEWDLLADHLARAASRYGDAYLRASSGDCTVHRVQRDVELAACADCARRLSRVRFHVARRMLCTRCAQRTLMRRACREAVHADDASAE